MGEMAEIKRFRGFFSFMFGLPLTALLMTCLTGCGAGNGSTKPLDPAGNTKFSYQLDTVDVTVPGMATQQDFLYLSDLHIAVDSADVAVKEDVLGRIAMYQNAGRTSAETWEELVSVCRDELVQSGNTDASSISIKSILLGGDMVDFASEANVEVLQEGLSQLTQADISWYYVRADHDTMPFYLEGITEEEARNYQQELGVFEEIEFVEYADFILLMWNDSTSNLSADGLAKVQEVFSKNKPIILLTHVPINSLVDGSLAEKSAEVFDNRVLLWGAQCYYWPDENTQAFLNMIYAEDTPVVEIVCGHLHFSWDGQITPQVHQHVFDPAYSGNIGVIRVHG